MSKTIYELSMVTSASKESIWALWANVGDWPVWDKELEWVTIDGAFKGGQTGKIKPKGAPGSRYVITDCVPFQRFSSQSKLPFATLFFDHIITPNNEGISVTHTIAIAGPLSGLFKRLLGKNLKNGLIAALPQLIGLAEKS
jgi:hypothetical protein